uniref:Autophagy-related protein 13 n=1 Tax=Macrostomum lignano TaxID=282301 RepID=A0A1I8FNF4_9PLAT
PVPDAARRCFRATSTVGVSPPRLPTWTALVAMATEILQDWKESKKFGQLLLLRLGLRIARHRTGWWRLQLRSAASGNSSQICGGDSRNSIYELTYSPIDPMMPKLPVTSLPNITASASSVTHRSIAARERHPVRCRLPAKARTVMAAPSRLRARMCRPAEIRRLFRAEVASEA